MEYPFLVLLKTFPVSCHHPLLVVLIQVSLFWVFFLCLCSNISLFLTFCILPGHSFVPPNVTVPISVFASFSSNLPAIFHVQTPVFVVQIAIQFHRLVQSISHQRSPCLHQGWQSILSTESSGNLAQRRFCSGNVFAFFI